MNCCDCGREIEGMLDEVADDLRLEGWDDDEIEECRTRCDQCFDDKKIMEHFRENPERFFEVARKALSGAPSGKLQ